LAVKPAFPLILMIIMESSSRKII